MSDDCLQESATPSDVAADGAFTGSLSTESLPTAGESQEGNDYQFGNTEPATEQNEAWNLDSYFQSQGEEKNIFSELSEEHLSQLEDVLSSDAVNSLLQQAADFQSLDSNLMMDTQAPSTSFAFDEATAHQIIQDGVREHELAVIAAAFNDHAYAMPVNREPKAGMSTEQFESPDLLPTEPVATTTTEDVQKKDSDIDESPQPVRRSTRISDAEQREMAEKILQENRQKAREALLTKEDVVDGEEEKEKEEPKKGKRGRKPKAEADPSNPLNTKWNKNNRRTRSTKGPGEPESGDEAATEQEEPPKPAASRAKKAATGTETPPPMKRVSRGKWKNPLFRDRPDTPDRASPAKTPPAKKTETTDTDGESTAGGGGGRGKKKEKQEDKVEKDTEEDATGEEKESPGNLKPKAVGKKGGKKAQGKAQGKGPKGKVKVEEEKEESVSSEEDIPLQQLKDTKQKALKIKAKPKPKAKATLVKPKSASNEDDDDNDNLPLKQLTKSPTKLKKLKAVISAKRAVKNVPQKAGLANSKSKLLKMRPQSQLLKKKILQKQKQAVRKQKLKEEEEARLAEEKHKLEMANAAEKLAAKRKARKSETEVFLDPTMTDLFKPDGLIVHEQDKDTPISPDAKSSKGQQIKVEKPDVKGAGDAKKVVNAKEEKKEKVEVRKSLDGKSEKSDVKKIIDEKSSEVKKVQDVESSKEADFKNEKPKVQKASDVKGESAEMKKVAEVKGEKPEVKKVTEVKGEKPEVKKGSEIKGEKSEVKKVSEVKGEKPEVKKVSEVKGEKPEVKKVAEVKGEKPEVKKVAEVKGEKPEVKGEKPEVKKVAEVKGEKPEPKKSSEVKGEKENVTKKPEKKVEESPHKKIAGENNGGVEVKPGKFYSNKKERGSVGENSSDKQDKERRHSKSSIPDKTSISEDKKTDTHEDSDSEGGLSYVDDENDSDWDPGEDSTTLYCLCNKPHNNRFMIQCDGCEKWYHGSCVGVSKAMGQEFESQNMDFICPVCTEAGIVPVNKAPKKFHSPVKLKRTESSSNHETSVTSTTSVDTPKKLSTSSDKRKSIEKPSYQKCVGKYCNKDARSGSVYCSNDCIIQHAKLSLKLLHQDREKVTPKKPEEPDTSSVKKDGESKVVVLERKTGCILNGPTAPTESNLQDWLEKHPTFEVLQPNISSTSSSSKSTSKSSSSSSSSHRHHHHRHSSSSSSRHGSSSSSKDRDRKDRDKRDHDRKDRDRKDRDKHHKDRHKSDSGTSEKKMEEKKDEGPDPIRLNVRKGLRDALANRADHADDVMLSGSEIKHLSLKIEEELYKYFKDVGHKYKSKYRSLVFNIKDPKNNGLFRKILSGKIRASKLVQMSSTELASKELAEWRKMETKHTLDMIEETEKKAMKEAVHIRKKTHKGEVELDEDLSTLRDEVEKPTPVKTKIEAKADLLSELIVDTTDKHRTHLFDLNCKVCTGKMAPPTDDSSAKKVTVAHAVDKTEEAEEEEEKTELKAEDIAKAEKAVKEALENVKKNKIEMPESPKVTVRSPDSALQSGLESRAKFTPSGPVLWKGFIHMQEFNKFFTSAYRVSGPTDGLGFADTIQICGRIVPEQIWDYLSKIKQASSRDICVIRFIPAGDEEKISYVNLYSYLNSRGRCGVVGNSPKHIKDFYIIPLASHSRIPQLLLPFDGPGLEDNRPHMLIGVIVRQKKKILKPEKPITPTMKTKQSSAMEGMSSSKKPRLSMDEEDPVFAYKPKGDKSVRSSSTPVYIPTAVSGGSGSSSEAGTPSGYKDSHDPIVKAFSMDEVAPLETENSPDAENEAYSPSKIAEEEEPYDPEMEEAETTKPAPSSAMLRAMQSTLASLGEIESSGNPAPPPTAVETPQKPKVSHSLPISSSNGNPKVAVTVPETKSSVQTLTPALSSQKQGAGATVADPSSHKAAFSVEKLVQQIASSTNPNEITALMVTALAASKQATNQQQALADLTQKIEEQKRLLALKKAEIEKVRNSPTLPTEAPTADDPIIIEVSPAVKKKSASSKSDPRQKEEVKEKILESVKEDPKTSSLPDVQKEILSISVSSSSAVNPLLKTESISVSSMKPHEMPLALQALMKDVMGHGTEQGIKSKKIQKEKEESKEAKSEAPHERDKDSLAIFKNLENRDKNVIPGLGDLPIASVLEQEEMMKTFEIVKGVALVTGDVSSDVKTSLEDDASLDKDYRTEQPEGKPKDDGSSKDEKSAHVLDRDERLVRGMLPRFIPTQNKKDWSSPTSSEQTESLDVDHRKFTATATTASSTIPHGGPPMMPPVPPPMKPQSVNPPLMGSPLLHQGGLPVSKEGNFRPIGGPSSIDSGQRDIDQRNTEGNMRPMGGNPFGLAGQDVDMRRTPACPPPPLPPPLNPMPRPPFPGPFPPGPRLPPNFRPPFPGPDVGNLRMRGPHPGAYGAEDVSGTKRGSPFHDGEAGGKKPRMPGHGFVPQEPLLPTPPGLPPLPDEPLPPPPQLPPPPMEKGDLTTPVIPVSKPDALLKHPKDQDHRGDNRSSNHRLDERRDSRDRDRDRDRYHSRHRHRDSRDRDRHRDRDYRSRDGRR